ncbi:MAG: trypsin-like peptidase domain-containing protein [Acidimicrobiia bacterium]
MGTDPAPRDRSVRSEITVVDEAGVDETTSSRDSAASRGRAADPDATAPLGPLDTDPIVSDSDSDETPVVSDETVVGTGNPQASATESEGLPGFGPRMALWWSNRRERRASSGAAGAGAPEVRYVRPHVLPRSVIGIVVVFLALAVGAAFSGTVLFSYYQSRLDGVEQRVDRYIGRFEERYDQALKGIARERESAVADLRRELEPLEQLRAGGEGLTELVSKLSESAYLVETQDEFGQPRVGSASVIAADAEKSYLVTSLSTVRASTAKPGPPINLRKGAESFPATLWTWHDERDLALLIVDRPNLPSIKWLPNGSAVGLGERVFSFAGIGGAGGSISQGFVLDVSAAGIQHDAAAGGAFSGAPLVNSKGEMVGVVSPVYAPLGFTSDRVTFAPSSAAFCEKVLRCNPDAQSGAPGARR